MTDLEAMRTVLDTLVDNHPAARDELVSWRSALDHPPAGTMRQWFTDHDGQAVDTFQMSRLNTPSRTVWSPLARTVDASAATYVLLNESRRDYKGMRVLATSTDTLAVTDGDQHIIYRAVR